MDGIGIMVQLLTHYADLTALIPANNIVSGNVPLGTLLPSASITRVSGIDNNIIKPGAKRLVTERISVLVQAKKLGDVHRALAQVRKAAADKMPTVAGVSDVVVHTQFTGPDMSDGANSFYAAAQDFKIRYNEIR